MLGVAQGDCYPRLLGSAGRRSSGRVVAKTSVAMTLFPSYLYCVATQVASTLFSEEV